MVKKNIKYLVMDVDGTLTDGKIYMGQDNELCKVFNVKDGCGIHDIAISSGLIPVIITGRKSHIVKNRCRELGIKHIYQGIEDKKEKLLSVTHNLSAVAYIGDDINDLSCIKAVKQSGGITGCPKDASHVIISLVDYVAQHNGGDGAVRDFIEWIIYNSNFPFENRI